MYLRTLQKKHRYQTGKLDAKFTAKCKTSKRVLWAFGTLYKTCVNKVNKCTNNKLISSIIAMQRMPRGDTSKSGKVSQCRNPFYYWPQKLDLQKSLIFNWKGILLTKTNMRKSVEMMLCLQIRYTDSWPCEEMHNKYTVVECTVNNFKGRLYEHHFTLNNLGWKPDKLRPLQPGLSGQRLSRFRSYSFTLIGVHAIGP